MKKKITFLFLFIISLYTTAQTETDIPIEGKIIDYGKPFERSILICGKKVEPKAMLTIKTPAGEDIFVYLQDYHCSDYFQRKILPLLLQDLNPKVEIRLLSCPDTVSLVGKYIAKEVLLKK